ncbi:MogA/MoaB family molybdenum cofactor biosynthesis protein [Ornithinimicrobium avium]|uniref:MogA/MoaB family molybdenum cofactor biosynthesis protein n=1 Tax=Ornithinimicrobium avium TaxID=2283195 RepID=A0A345NNB2_9MICO|nr:MogA/MoaB family molybdenum cofactor biosynthesis protein [Ornithinimicrobium avium]AXH96520.1 MogA/MoaB family molybdenum cofactor biosynthesis protein [Ornithinimicrobium avium]
MTSPSPAARPATAITVSDRSSDGRREDESGRVLVTALRTYGYAVDEPVVVPDGVESVAAALRGAVGQRHRLVVTTGGTGMGPRDLTPEATRQVITRDNPGLAELLRHEGARHTPYAAASRGVVGVVDWPDDVGVGGTLVVNLPGRPSAVQEGMDVLGPLLEHLIDQVAGGDH